MGVQREEAVSERKQAEQEVEAVCDKECLLDSFHRGVSVDFAELCQDKVLVHEDVGHQAQLVQQVHDQQH